MTSTTINRTRTLRTPRTRGSVSGFGLVLLGIWGGIIAFVGPYFDYGYAPDTTWTWTAARGVLEVLPAAVTFVAGLMLLGAADRITGLFASWCAVVAGSWFVVGPLLAPIWKSDYLGAPLGGTSRVAVEQIGMFYGLGAAIILFAAFALGRFSVVGVRDVAHAERLAARSDGPTAVDDTVPAADEPVSDPERVGPAHERKVYPEQATRPAGMPPVPEHDPAEPRRYRMRGFGWHHGARSR